MTTLGERVFMALAEVKAYRDQGPGRLSGNYVRFLCPVHEGDNRESFSVNAESGWFRCFNCGVEGRIEDWVPGGQTETPGRAGVGRVLRQTIPVTRADLTDLVPAFQDALAGPGATARRARSYLDRRGISAETAHRCGIGLAAAGSWPHYAEEDAYPINQWTDGRIVFPLVAPDGGVVNLYGRGVETGSGGHFNGRSKHVLLPGAKAPFQATPAGTDSRVILCEGPFDALSLAEIGFTGAIALCGLGEPVWEWIADAHEVVIALDADEAGQSRTPGLGAAAAFRGKRVFLFDWEPYRDRAKDLNELLVQSLLHEATSKMRGC